MNHFKTFFSPNKWKVTGFYPYTSCVINRIMETNFNYKTDSDEFLEMLWNKYWAEAEKLGCRSENKIVLQITNDETFSTQNVPHNAILYIGYYDNQIHLGLNLYQDEWLKDCNKFFPLN